MSRIYRWHPQLKAGSYGPVVSGAALHLQQSDIDGACGTHCALMALMVLGVINRSDLDELPRARKKPLAQFWQRTAAYYFVGSNPRQLQSVLAPYKESVTCRVLPKKNRQTETLLTLQMDGVCIIGIRNDQFSHWVLAIGTGGKEGFDGTEAKTLLILDPNVPPIPLLSWNATLSLKAKRHGHRYETSLFAHNVNICATLGLLPSITKIDADLDLDLDIDH